MPIDSWDFAQSRIKHNKPFKSVDRLKLVFVCKSTLDSNKVVDAQPALACIMPCGWAVYERDGKTYVASMNISMMGLLFKGVVKKTLRSVGRDEAELLHNILE